MKRSFGVPALLFTAVLFGLLGGVAARFWFVPTAETANSSTAVADLLLGNAKAVRTERWPLFADGAEAPPTEVEITRVEDRIFHGPRLILRSPARPELGSLVLASDTHEVFIEGRCLDARMGKEWLVVRIALSDQHPDARVCGVAVMHGEFPRFQAECHDGIRIDGGFSLGGDAPLPLMSCQGDQTPAADDKPGSCVCHLDKLEALEGGL